MSSAASQKNVSVLNPRLGIVVHALGFALFYFLAIQINIHLRTMGASWVESPVEVGVKWNPTLVKGLSLGQWPTVVDWLWIRALQDPSLSHVPEGTRASIFYDFDLATDLDPAFSDVYIYGGNLLVVVRDDKIGAVTILKKGEAFRREELPKYPEEFFKRFWSRGWWVPLSLGYTYLQELNDVVNAADAFTAAGAISGVPDHIKNLGNRLKTRSGQYEVALNLLDMLVMQAKDERVISGLQAKRKNLLINKYLFDLNEDFTEFLRKQPDYRKTFSLTKESLELYWRRFRKENGISQTDPLGGTLSLTDQGHVTSSTERDKVFGLD